MRPIPIKALCEEKRTRSDGTALIYLQYFHDGEHRVFLNTRLAIPPQYWHKQHQCVIETLPPSNGNAADINKEVERQLKLASDLITYTKEQGIAEKGAFVKKYFHPTLNLERLIWVKTPAPKRPRKPKEYYAARKFDKNLSPVLRELKILEILRRNLRLFKLEEKWLVPALQKRVFRSINSHRSPE